MSSVRVAAVQDRSSVRPTAARAAARVRPASEGAQAAPHRAIPREQSVQRLVQALPARSEAPARWSGPVVQADGQAGSLPAQQVHQAAKVGISGAGGTLPHLDKIQRAFGAHDVSHVVAHTDWAAKKGSEAMGARAFTTGSHVAFASAPTLHTAAHEAAHVVQQQQGVQLKGGVGRVGDPYEQHADAVADAVVSGKSAEPLLAPFARGGSGGGGAVQRDEDISAKYARNSLDVRTPLPDTRVTNHPDPANEVTTFSPEHQRIINRHTTRLGRDTKFYRWGNYSNEKHYVARNGFSLASVNQSSHTYGHGLYLADKPWTSAQYSSDNDNAILEVTIPRNTLVTDYRHCPEDVKAELRESVRVPTLMLYSDHKWFVLKDDRVRIRVNWYQPTQQELNSANLKNGFRNTRSGNLADVRDLYTRQIIERQMSRSLRIPSNLAALMANLAPAKMQRVQSYVAAIRRYEYTPFRLSARSLDFAEEYREYKANIRATNRYSKYFTDEVDTALTAWAADPFSYGPTDFVTDVLDPYHDAVKGYLTDRKDNLSERKLRNTGAKSEEIGTFRRRLVSFKCFLDHCQSANGLVVSSPMGLGSNLFHRNTEFH